MAVRVEALEVLQNLAPNWSLRSVFACVRACVGGEGGRGLLEPLVCLCCTTSPPSGACCLSVAVVFQCLPACLSVSVCLSFRVSSCLSFSVCLSVSLCLPVSLSVSACPSFCVCLPVFQCLSVCLSVSACLSFCVCLSESICLLCLSGSILTILCVCRGGREHGGRGVP